MKKYGVNTSSQNFQKRKILNIRKEQIYATNCWNRPVIHYNRQNSVTRIDKPAGTRLILNDKTQNENSNQEISMNATKYDRME